MPEGPECKLSVEWLKKQLLADPDHRIAAARLDDFSLLETGRYKEGRPRPSGFEALARYLPGPTRTSLIGLTVADVGVKGKLTWWELETPSRGQPLFLHVTYGMTGQWSGRSTPHAAFSAAVTRPGGPTRTLYFNDQRHFGTIAVLDLLGHRRKVAALGPDMLSAPPDPVTFVARLRKRPAEERLCDVLMDQRVVSGVGNYIRAEALHGAGLSPFRKISECSDSDLHGLRDAIIRVMTESYRLGGATISTHYSPEGEIGVYKHQFRVYGREETPDGRPVRRDPAGDNRSIWWDPETQK